MQVPDEVSFCQAQIVAAVEIKQVQEFRDRFAPNLPIADFLAVRYRVIEDFKGSPATNGMFLTAKYSGACGEPSKEGAIALVHISSGGGVGSCGSNTMSFDPESKDGRALLARFRKIQSNYRRSPHAFCDKVEKDARHKGLIPK